MPSSTDKAFERQLIDLIPHMRAFARSLCGDAVAADDLAQEALARAWRCRDSYKMGTNLKAWTFMIVRNQFYSEKRRSWRWLELDQDRAEATLTATENADGVVALDEVRRALMTMSPSRREALVLVGAGGMSYEEAAHVMGVAVGTVKSRVSRARDELQSILETGAFVRDQQPASMAMDAILAILPRAAVA